MTAALMHVVVAATAAAAAAVLVVTLRPFRRAPVPYRLLRVALPPPVPSATGVPGRPAADESTATPVAAPVPAGASAAPAPQPAPGGMLEVYVLPDEDDACAQALEALLPRLGLAAPPGAVMDAPATPLATAACAPVPVLAPTPVLASGVGIRHVISLDAEWAFEDLVPWAPDGLAQQPLADKQRRGVSVLQLAGAGWCMLLRPDRLQRGCPAPLAVVLNDASVCKVGLGVMEDCKRLEAQWGLRVQVQGMVDLGLMAQLCVPDLLDLHGGSLAALTAALLRRQLHKQLQRSAWDAPRLSKAQIEYAAHDAWASREVLLAMLRRAAHAALGHAAGPAAATAPSANRAVAPLHNFGTAAAAVAAVGNATAAAATMSIAAVSIAAIPGTAVGTAATDAVAIASATAGTCSNGLAPALSTTMSSAISTGDGGGEVTETAAAQTTGQQLLATFKIQTRGMPLPPPLPEAQALASGPLASETEAWVLTAAVLAAARDAPRLRQLQQALAAAASTARASPCADEQRCVRVLLALAAPRGNRPAGAHAATAAGAAAPRAALLAAAHAPEAGRWQSAGGLPSAELAAPATGRVVSVHSAEGRSGGSEGGSGVAKPSHPLRKSKLYENCRLEAPDGAVLCTCSRRKILWYVERSLGTIICEDPLTLRLHFEPQGRGQADDNYYTSDKENRCVVCGVSCEAGTPERPADAGAPGDLNNGTSTAQGITFVRDGDIKAASRSGDEGPGSNFGGGGGLGTPAAGASTHGDADAGGAFFACLRHSVVPHCYRRCFQPCFKSHLSHDVVLLCSACHRTCSLHDHRRMAYLGKLYGAPLEEDNQKYKHDTAVSTARSAARALLNTKVSLPEARRRELAVALASFLGEPLDEALQPARLREVASLDPRKPASEWMSHAEKVVAALRSPADVEAFVQSWRLHFLAVMQPAFLPPHWSVAARVANSTAVSGPEDNQRAAGHVGNGV